MIADVADQQRAVAVERDAVRLAQLRGGRSAAVAAESRRPSASDGRDHVRAHVDLPHHVAVALDDE